MLFVYSFFCIILLCYVICWQEPAHMKIQYHRHLYQSHLLFFEQPLIGLVDYPDDEEDDEEEDAATSPAKRARLNAS